MRPPPRSTGTCHRPHGSHSVPVPVLAPHQCLIRLIRRCLANGDGCRRSAHAALTLTPHVALGDRDSTGDPVTAGPHLVTDELPLLLVVILVEQLHLVWGQVHGVLRSDGGQGWRSPQKSTPRGCSIHCSPITGVSAQQWDDGDTSDGMGTLKG